MFKMELHLGFSIQYAVVKNDKAMYNFSVGTNILLL